jgi:hypothetical protein
VFGVVPRPDADLVRGIAGSDPVAVGAELCGWWGEEEGGRENEEKGKFFLMTNK